ncbi:MAG TPA: TonB C-terminal domain-containing protein [Polyangiaceae bacterium]|nr:TonB C-terminal domain-containing protein [Polyangiaceae bacterium]
MSGTASRLAFSQREVGIACAFAMTLQAAFFALLIWAGKNDSRIAAKEEPKPQLVPIAVKPVLDDLPLLKLGSKQKAKLPDMWKKQPPIKRYEDRAAPSSKADDQVKPIDPEKKLADKDHEAPPEDAEIAKQVDTKLEDAEQKPENAMTEEGAADGVKEGTETDPLKARAIDQYKAKLAAWFNSRFKPPEDAIPCEELIKLGTSVSVRVGSDRSVAGFSITSPSGNAVFDAKVQSTLQNLVGQELPPPPPLYPDILESTLYPRLSGAGRKCN